MPSFSTRITEHQGGHVLEILCDQKPWGETYTYDDHFRFGPFKACMIVAAQSVIADFVESDGQKPALGTTVIAHDDPKDPSFSPACSTYDHFPVRHRRVDRPYLKLRVGRYSYGFGVSKAEALIVLMEKVKAFARNHRA
jgi:hypothetical protein